MQVYGSLNHLYNKFLSKAYECWELPCLVDELVYMRDEIMKKDVSSPEVYNRLKPNLNKVSELIHLKKKIIFESSEYDDVALLKYSHAKEILAAAIDEEERDMVWKSLQNLVKQMGLVQSVSACLPSVVKMLNSFQQNNPDVNLKDPKAKQMLIEKLMNDKEFGNSAKSMFDDVHEETSILGNLPDKLKALGLTTLGQEEEEAVEEEGNEGEEEQDTKEDVETSKESVTFSAGDLFKDTVKKRRKQKKNAPKKQNMFAEAAKMMSQENIYTTEFKELKKDIGSALDGTHENSDEIKAMMQTLMSKGMGSGVDMTAMMQSISAVDMSSMMKRFGGGK